jgi:hypothetical protein
MPGEMIQIDEWVFEPFDMLSVNLILYFICTISCMLLVAFFRWSIKSCSDFNSIKKIVLIISILFLFAICLILLPLIIGGINPQRHPSEYFNVLTFSDFASLLPLLISIVNVGSIFPLLLFLVLLITIPANKLVWELLNRGLYNLAHVKTIANKGILITMASALFALGFKFTMLYPGLNTHEVLIDNHSSVNVEYLSKDTIKYLNSHSEILKDTVIEYENSIIDTLKINYIENCTKVLCTGWLETGGNKTYIWFEWGTTPEFENATKKWIFINDSQFGCWVKNLHENTVYFFRTAKMDGLGTHYTKTSLFKTAICK